MRKTITEPADIEGHFIVKVVDECGRQIWRRDGTARYAESWLYEDPYAEVEKPTGGKPIAYSSRGIV